jgi:integrase/recombinase XerD
VGFFILGGCGGRWSSFCGISGLHLAYNPAHTMITVFKKKSRDKKKYWYYLQYGKGVGQRVALGIFTIIRADDEQKRWNLIELARVQEKLMEAMLGNQTRSKKTNFIGFYERFVDDNERPGKRHLASSLTQFKAFIAAKGINPDTLTEDNVIAFRRYLLDRFNGETPLNYFGCFKSVVKSAAKAGYFNGNVAEDVKGRKNPSRGRDFLTSEEYLQLCNHPCPNAEVARAAIASLYTGLAWVDIKLLTYEMISAGVLTIKRQKSKVVGRIPVHPSLTPILMTGKGLVFNLPTANGCNKILKAWAESAGITKHITWHCLRLSFSVDLLNKGVATTTVAGLMLHSSTTMVSKIYRRYLDSEGLEAIKKLPG